jgi:hypothetical protein
MEECFWHEAVGKMSAGNSAGALYIRNRNSIGKRVCRGAPSWPPVACFITEDIELKGVTCYRGMPLALGETKFITEDIELIGVRCY